MWVIHLRLTVPSAICDEVVERLIGDPGVAHLARVRGAAITPPGELLLCDVAREVANDVIEWLQDQGVHHEGYIAMDTIDAVVSDAAARAESRSPADGTDVLIWEELESRAREESRTTFSFLLFMSVAAVIAVVGILLDSPILIVAAMVVGPEYGPIAAICVGLARMRWRAAGRALAALAFGLLTAGLASVLATAIFRVTALAPDSFALSSRQLTAFISRPGALAAVVAVLAGVIGMLSLTESRTNSLVGVLVSVTTIPSVGNAGAAAAYGEWQELAGSAVQLGINVLGLLVAGLVTLLIQSWYTSQRPLAVLDNVSRGSFRTKPRRSSGR